MDAVEPDRAAVAAFWARFCAETCHAGEPADDDPELLFERFALVRPR